jgi:hypothetical protein
LPFRASSKENAAGFFKVFLLYVVSRTQARLEEHWMARHRKDLGARKHVRVELHKAGFLIPAPDAPWLECQIIDVSDTGACVEVGALAVPEIFGLAFTAKGEVLRVCSLVWRQGEVVGARFVTAKELRQGLTAGGEADSASEKSAFD